MRSAETITPPSVHVASSTDPAVLGAILLPSTSMAVWERGLHDGLADAVRAALASKLGALRFTSRLGDIEGDLHARLVAAGLQRGPSIALARDVETLATKFGRIMDRDLFDIRLERVTGDACKRFHSDYVTARLITTYAGRATEWLDQACAARLAAGVHPADLSVRRLEEGDVAVLKGRLWADDRAIVHRSPPIAGTGEERLLLVINPEELPPTAIH